MSGDGPVQAVLFDLDGTLVDSAADLHAALNRLRGELGLGPFPFGVFRGLVSQGARAMLSRGLLPESPGSIDALLPRFLELYAGLLARHSRCFPGVHALLDALEQRAVPWGIVTNKPGWLARPLLGGLGLQTRCRVLVAGDTLALKKPDPAPVLHACQALGLPPGRCLFVGDDERDLKAGRAAGCPSVLVGYGYVDDAARAAAWRADDWADTALDLLRWI